jgi:hypothetical protein
MPDHFESRMNFIIEQQAQFVVDIQLLKERQADTLRLVDANTGMIRQLVDVTMSLAHHGEETDRRLQETDQRMQETDRRLRALGEETDRRIRELVESGAHTDRRLDALIDVVDKLTRRNGP